MGRKAKLKQLRRQSQGQEQSPMSTQPTHFESTQFVQQLQVEGYKLDQAQHSPDVPLPKPLKKPNPQL
ncbi:hypothetical protein [Coleofasciculus sp. G2-EDA-02]|uniref:hypothetical protein n=1 Tax=Coleofasciculus sp. G2-EDA-02 TaxID=3069529 RepID=UPI0032FB08FC